MLEKEIKTVLFLFFITFFFLIVQTTLLPKAAVASIVPNLLFITLCLTGVFKGPLWGGMYGAILGSLLGMLNMYLVISIIIYFSCGTLCGLFQSSVYSNKKVIAALFCFVGTWVLHFISWITTALFLKETFYIPWEVVFFTPLLHGALAYLFFPVASLVFALAED